ncbi:MAG: AraC family transcriptional regulator [Clostridia bacterium]|nr:AraC family transcriptional regulator [Clostridia bacterium]
MLQFFAGNYKTELDQFPSPILLYVSKIDAADLAEHPRTAHAHNNWFEMVLITRGKGRVIIEDRAYDVSQGDLLLYNRGVVHDELPEMNRDMDILCMAITGFQLPELERDCSVHPQAVPVITLGAAYENIRSIWTIIFDTLKENNINANITCHYLMQSLLTFIFPRAEKDILLKDEDEIGLFETGKQIKKYIDEHYAEQLSLQSLGKAMNLSPFYISHVFKKTTGYAPAQYISKRRLGEAQEKLIHSKLPITDIALDVGYNNISSFNYAFAKSIGMSPSLFRSTYSNQ